jgi:cation-transporting ATPase E
VCLVVLEDTVRADATEIFAYFRDQGVELKVISGDHPATVAAVARRAGIEGAETGFDARELSEDAEELADTLERTTVFGRVTPHQKRAMVHALQGRGHTVAMTGDGVNDVLALKDSDMGIAMGSGSSSTRAVAQLVLLDNRFATLPRVLAEGRKVINNIERVANLFITKAAYAVLLTALVGIAGSPFPFLPRQLTLIGSFSIGLPGFFLALAPNDRLVVPGFLRRVLRFSLPAGAIAGITTFVGYEVVRRIDDSLDEARTCATFTLLSIGLVILLLISRPLKPWKVALVVAMAASYLVVLAVPFTRDYFELVLPDGIAWLVVALAALAGGTGAWLTARLVDGDRS